MSLSREFMEELIFGTGDFPRYTQDSPILPDVWIQYAQDPNKPLDLLVRPHRDATAAEVAETLAKELPKPPPDDYRESYQLAHTFGTVAVRLYFHELVRYVLPMTPWWKQHALNEQYRKLPKRYTKKQVAQLSKALRDLDARPSHAQLAWGEQTPVDSARQKRLRTWDPGLLWMLSIIGHVSWARSHGETDLTESAGSRFGRANPDELVNEVSELFEKLPELHEHAQGTVWLVNRNREVKSAVGDSTRAIKADAARFVFDVDCSRITWAIIDCGIEADHPAFLQRDRDGNIVRDENQKPISRVRVTYDFTDIRTLLDPSQQSLPERLRYAFERTGERGQNLKADLSSLKRYLQAGRDLDWDLLEPLLRVPHDDDYQRPTASHGTHVAGILAADWPEDSLEGICPDINLYDFRVLGANGKGDEFNVIAALQFIRHLNAKHDYMVIHGVNMSLSIMHDVANFACGRTPVCDESDRVAASNVVVVAAAGNNGYVKYVTSSAERVLGGYNTVSITDPGNAQEVITVGATHRDKPHTYGVSYFSSRGPTGDGRTKPDIVAPGEKIEAPVPGGGRERKDGTSMAAPHVSGAAAMLMARHRELVGQPQRIKEILCKTATDLGREHYFQGAGMLDVLRALQSV